MPRFYYCASWCLIEPQYWYLYRLVINPTYLYLFAPNLKQLVSLCGHIQIYEQLYWAFLSRRIDFFCGIRDWLQKFKGIRDSNRVKVIRDVEWDQKYSAGCGKWLDFLNPSENSTHIDLMMNRQRSKNQGRILHFLYL